MPPRRKKQQVESNHTQDAKEYTDAGNKIRSITPKTLISIQNQPDLKVDTGAGDQYLYTVLRLINIIDFLNETVPLIANCPFHHPDINNKYKVHIQALSKLGDYFKAESIGTLEYLGNFNEGWSVISNIANTFDFNLFHERFSGCRSCISRILRQVVQLAHEDPRTEPRIFELFKSVTATRKRLATRLSVLVRGHKIGTIITLWEKLIETQKEVIQFLKITNLVVPETIATVNNYFNSMFDLTLHLKNLLVIQQLAHTINQCLNDPSRLQTAADDVETDNSFENEIDRTMIDELVFEVRGTTKFLQSYTEFTKTVKANQSREEFLEKLKVILIESQSYDNFDLGPTLYSLFYNFRKLYFESLPIIIIAETDTSAKAIRKVYLELQVLLNSFKSIIGKEIDVDAISELLLPNIANVRRACADTEFEQINNILSCLDVIFNELHTINDTLCVSFQIDQFLSKLKDPELNQLNFDCSFYEPPIVMDKYDADKERPEKVIHNFDEIIDTFVNRLASLGFHIIIKLDYTSPTSSVIEVPLLADVFQDFQENLNYSSLYNLMKGPANESDFFSYIFETQKEAMVLSTEKEKTLVNNLAILCQFYYLLMALDAANLIDFSNSLHLSYMRSYSMIYLKNDSVGSLMNGLNSPFDFHEIPNLSALENELKDNTEILEIDQEVSNVRVLLFSFIQAVSHLSPTVLYDHIDPIGAIIAWFVNPINSFSESLSSESFFQLLTRLQKANIPEIGPYVEKLSQLYYHIITHRKDTPIITYLTLFLDVQPPNALIYKPLVTILVDAIEKCMNFGILNCDVRIIEQLKAHDNDQEIVSHLCRELRKTMITSHEILLKKISIATLNLTTSGPLNSSCDLLIRGSLICKSVKSFVTNLVIFQNQHEAPQEKIDLLWQYITQISQFIVFIATFDVLLKPTSFSIMRQLNFTQYLSFFCNLMIYLSRSMNLDDEQQIKEIVELSTDIKNIISRTTLTVEIHPDTVNDVISLYSDLRLKYNLFDSIPLIETARQLIDHISYSSELKNLFEKSLEHIESPTDLHKSQELLDHLHEMILQILHSYRKNEKMFKELFDTCSTILDIFTTLIMYSSGIDDADSFFIAFSTNRYVFPFRSPLYIEPLSVPPVLIPPLLPHQSTCSSTNKVFPNLTSEIIQEKADIAIENISDLIAITRQKEIPLTTVLPIEAQQCLMDSFITTKENYEESQKKQKEQTNELNNIEDKSQLMTVSLMRKQIERLEAESEQLKSRIDVMNETTETLYREFVIKQNEQFDKLMGEHQKEIDIIRNSKLRIKQLTISNKASSKALRHKRLMIKQIEEENQNLTLANEILSNSIELRRPIKAVFDDLCEVSQKNSEKQNEEQQKIEGDDEQEIDEDINEIEENSFQETSAHEESSSPPLSPTSQSNLIEILNLVKPEQILESAGPNKNEDVFIPEALKEMVNPTFASLRLEDNDIIHQTIELNYQHESNSKSEFDDNEDSIKSPNDAASFENEYSPTEIKKLKEKCEMFQRRKKAMQELAQEQLKKLLTNTKD